MSAGLTILVDGVAVNAVTGQTVAGAMLAAGIVRFRDDPDGGPRGLWCNMGSCGECFVGIADRRVRACLAVVAPGMAVSTGA